MSEAINISVLNLSIALFFILISGITSMIYSLKLENDLFIGSLRAIAQLTAMGYILKFIFNINSIWLVLLMFFIMTFFAAEIVRGRVKKQKVSYFIPTLISVQVTFFLITFVVTKMIISTTPWWLPQYFIPIGGMVAGNSMGALSVSLDRLFSEFKSKRNEVEMLLCLGATPTEASQNIFRSSLRAGMMPAINNLMGVGLVSIPGMMTGQIIAGSDPSEAMKYQIVVMLMLTASTAIASFMVLKIVSRRCFGKYANLKV